MDIENSSLLTDGKALFLAYDQGLEHGPRDFGWQNANPQYIIDIAQQGQFNGVIFQKGTAEQYNQELHDSNVPLIVKLNGKTRLTDGDPVSRQICTVEKAVELGAAAVGYTIYIGSQHEPVLFHEFAAIQETAHAHDMPAIVWMYPRGSAVEGMNAAELMTYAARVGLEIGADIVKIKYAGTPDDLEWAVRCAGKTKIVISGGTKTDDTELLQDVQDIMDAGAAGMAIGRNIWQRDKPLDITQRLQDGIF